MSLMDYNKNFEERFNLLNKEQKESVMQTEGPVMVIAGPGTGKTEMLAARIANILKSSEAGALPHNILCLTYTDAGRIAMRKRLLEFIGSDAHKVNIHTYHSFCNEVIQQNLDYFGKKNLQHISDLEKVSFLEKIVDSFSPSHTLFKSSGYFEAVRLKRLFETMKSENWDIITVEKAIDDYLSDLPNREEFLYKRKSGEFNKGDLNLRKFNIEKEKMDQLRVAVKEFPKYKKNLEDSERYDYQDMILWVIKAFKENENILARYQEQFLYILVDEYQDTNGSQNEVLNLLINYWEEPNIFIVGDDDQSIFRFQGANLRNIMSFYHKYQNSVKTIVITKNYRSSQSILDTAQVLIERNSERLVSEIPNLEKTLIAENIKVKDSNIKPKFIEYYNIAHEEAGILQEIEKLYNEDVDLNEVAVIYKNHKQAQNIIKLLEQKKIPLSVKESTDVLELPFTEKILNILSYISAEIETPNSGENLLFQIMHYDFFEISPRDIAVIFTKKKQLNKQNEENLALREFLSKEDILNEMNIETKGAVQKFEKNINNWIQGYFNVTLQEQIEKIITQGGILSYIMNSNDKIWLMRVLTTLFNFVKEESTKNPNITIKSFLKTIEQMKDHGISMPLSKLTFAKNGVNFVTAHSSKGLEFKYVFIIGVNKDIWDSENKGFYQYTFPDTLTLSNTGDFLEENRRLFFVALTRAKESLTVSYSAKNSNDKDLEQSQFISEIIDSLDQEIEKKNLNDNDILKYHEMLFSEYEKKDNEFFDKEYINELLKDYRMNTTHLNKYLKCPITFYFESLLKVPSAMNEHTSFGTAIHYSLEKFFKDAKENNYFPEKESIYKYFVQSMNYNKASFTPEQFKRKMEYGAEVLNDFYDNYIDSWNLNVKLEYGVSNISIDGVPVSGQIDKIEFINNNNDINVIDYKTGKYRKEKLKRPDEKDLLGGDYWRQLVFYKILIDNDPMKNWNTVSGEIDFVEKDSYSKEFKKEQILITAEDEEIVKNQIRDVYKKIMNHEFNRGCNEDDCRWCNFIKHHY